MNKFFINKAMWRGVGFLLGLGLIVGNAGLAQAEITQMPRMELTAGFYRLESEVAANDGDRQLGLMGRRSLGANQAMLFVFERVGQHCMWMKNTFLPLSVAFLDKEGRILNIEEMQPQTENNHCAAAPGAAFALEVNQGWFAQKGIKVGQKIGGIERAPQPR